jgi:hypothetical protein
MTDAQIEKMVEQRNAQMKAEGDARGAYFAATHERAIAIGAGTATQAQYDALMTIRSRWMELRAA